MEIIRIQAKSNISFEEAKRLASEHLSERMGDPMTLSWGNACNDTSSLDQECLDDCREPWESYGESRDGVRVDVGPCFSFYFRDATKL